MAASADTGWELSVTRYVAASPETVWHIMTERQTEWWCPLPWRAEFVEQDWRAGGRTCTVMHGPEGEKHPHEGIFLEVTPGVRFVSTDALKGDHMPSDAFMIGIWEIAPEGDGTRYTARARHWTEEKCKAHLEMGFEEGWGACADQLVTLCEGGTLGPA
jgi:uncharacterized protein YndB with AHSA1/START domain